MLWEHAQDHGSFRHSSDNFYTTIKVKCGTDTALIARVQETLKVTPTENIRRFAARNIYTKSTTTIAQIPIEEPDGDITALPPAPAQPLRRQPKTQGLATSSLRSRSLDEHPEALPDRTLRRSRSINDLEEGDKKKESVWRRFIQALKKTFRKEKEPAVKSKGLVISGPTDFKHLQTGTACLPGQRAPVNNNTEGDTEDWETVRQSESFNG